MRDSGSSQARAALWMSGTVVSFSAMAVAGREASGQLDTFEVMTYRSIVGVMLVLIFAGVTGRLQSINLRNMRLQTLRSCSHFVATNLWLFAVASIPLAQVFAFEFLTPLWTAALAPLLLGERISLTTKLTTVCGFLGILLLTRPGLAELSPGLVAAMFCAIGFAAAAISTRKLVRVQTVTAILFWMCTIQTFLSLGCALADGQIAIPNGNAIFSVMVISISGLTAHICLTNALKIAPTTIVMPMDFVRLPAIAVVGLVLYGEQVDVYMVAGGLVILAANFVNIRSSGRR